MYRMFRNQLAKHLIPVVETKDNVVFEMQDEGILKIYPFSLMAFDKKQ